MPFFPRTRSALVFTIILAPLVAFAGATAAHKLYQHFRSEELTPVDAMTTAPDFPKDFAWLNTDQPLSFKGNLKGQVVVMDFWCYCCINCMHVLPDLEALQAKYADQPVVILGVHSNKYDNEADPANIRAAIQRYNITHPVIVDKNMQIWNDYGVNSWPTLIVVGADGEIIGQVSGEGHRDVLDKSIAKALADGKAKGVLAKAPLKLAHEGQVRAATGLSFPGKVLADPAGNDGKGRLFIVDSNHNRIVITSFPDEAGHAQLLETIGSGDTGQADGAFAQATFNRPQGAVLAGNTLWIADTENHLVRRADLTKQTVTTVLGTGKQVYDPEAGKSGRDQGLNSPWDVATSGNRLYISNAGQHQLFSMNIMTGMTEVLAGSGSEDIADGRGSSADLAQPSGMALDAKNQILYFTDSETSSLRDVDLKTDTVSTIIGHGLFDFGDIDGDRKTARFQHDLGVAVSADGSKLYLADTYNHKIRTVDPVARTAVTLAGDGKPGAGTPGGALELFEPASVAVASPDTLFIADTNNHRIIRLDPKTGAWKEIMIDGLFAPGVEKITLDPKAKDAGNVDFSTGGQTTLNFKIAIPERQHFTPGAPVSLKITDDKQILYTATIWVPETASATAASTPENQLSAMIPPEALATKPKELYITVYYTRCSSGASAVCTPDKAAWKMAPGFVESGKGALTLTQ